MGSELNLIRDIAICIVAAWCLGIVAQILKQPVILAYLVGGFALGPAGLALLKSEESVNTIARLGLIFLLFMIGLEIDLKKIMRAGKSITLTALVQLIAGCAMGVIFFRLLGFPLGGAAWDALYLAVAAALSSTVIIVKLLYDKRELDTLPGRITLGVLVLQDLFAILFLAVQPNLNDLRAAVLLHSFVNVAVLLATALALSRYVLPAIFRHVARLPELVLVGAIAWCLMVAELGERLHLSREMGALVAGVSLSTFPYALDVTAKVTSLRDFFVTLFFVGLGMTIPLPTGPIIFWAVVFALFTVVSRLVTTFFPLYRMRQGLRTSLLPAINLCQVSEFSLVVLSLGKQHGHFANANTTGMVALAFALLATVSTFGIMKSDTLVRAMIPWLKRRGLRDLDHTHDALEDGQQHGARVLLLGFHRTASSLLEELRRSHPTMLEHLAVVDFNPQAHAQLKAIGIKAIYGDISQRDTLVHAGVARAQTLVCTVPDSLLKGISNTRLVRQLRELNPDAQILAPAETLDEVTELYAAGANYVTVARLGEAADLCDALRAAESGLLDEKRAHLETKLAGRAEVLP